MIWIFLSVVAICATFLVAGKYYLDLTHPKQPDISEDFKLRLEKLEQAAQFKKLR